MSEFIVKTAFLGRVPYMDAWELQKVLLEEASGRVTGRRDTGFILFLEHDPVITLGRSGTWGHLLRPRSEIEKAGVSLVECDRGGDITVHYPGQLVTYLMLPMENLRRNIHWFLWRLEETGIKTAARLGINGRREEGLTGVWVGDDKLMAIGVGFRRWVSCHGTAFNVARDPGISDMVVPCGIEGKGVTSVEELTGACHGAGRSRPSLEEAAALMRVSIEETFDIDTVEVCEEELWAAASLHGS